MSQPSACPNCGEPAPGEYCPSCGQSLRDPRRSVTRWIADVAAEELAVGARTPRTLRTLVLHPGRLTLDWIEGRRARYLGALRLFLITTAVFFAVTFFLGLPIGPGLSVERFTPSDVPVGNRVEEIALNAVAGRMQTVLTVCVFLLVPAFALWLAFVHRREDRVFADHVIFSLHQHTLLLALSALAWPLFFLGRPGVVAGLVVMAAAGLHTLLAYRRVYPDPWWWLRFVAVGGGWGGAFVAAVVFGAHEAATMSDVPSDPPMRYHATALWEEANDHHTAEDTAVARALRELSLAAFQRVDKEYLLDWDAFRIADLEVELGRAEAGLRRVERFLEDHPEHPGVLGLAALAAARAGDTALARRRARAFLRRWGEDTLNTGSSFYPRYLEYRRHATDLLGIPDDSPESLPGR